jgi:uncharacterized protein YaaN involved in tellurite resistance
MNTKIVQLLKNISLDMNSLALELEKQQDTIDSKIAMLEYQTDQNCNTLRAVANAILNQLG